jgi:hypothetical protein
MSFWKNEVKKKFNTSVFHLHFVNLTQKTLAIAVISVLLLATATYIIVSRWDNLFGTGGQNDMDVLLYDANRREVIQELKAFKLKKLIEHRDLVLRKENFTQISDYQKYVTPNHQVVTSYLATSGITTTQQAYATAVDWIWVSDQTLHGKPEYWMLPAAFISDTPADPDNPLLGDMVSDCESQAYTLVSLLEALGTSKSNVRVVVGEVNFSGETGGHAWVQLYQNGDWFELEATSGSFWDDDDQQLVENIGFPYNYFKTHPYPVVEHWAFFNDQYYYNPHSGQQSTNLPLYWFND